ncbi:MAG: hypothetical protein ACI970_001656 [Myxococcota bacterium]|jgi:hypothetical protein
MTDDHTRPSTDPELASLQRLARVGLADLATLGNDLRAALWTAIVDDAKAEAEAGDARGPTTVLDLPQLREPRARRQWPLLVAAAVLSLVAGTGIGLGFAWRDAADPTPGTTLASFDLDALAPDVVATTATLTQVGDDRAVLVDLARLPTIDGFHEVWLLSADATRLVSLGPVRTDGTYIVPANVDLIELPVLDVSAEPSDGDPGHSGDSLLRGQVTWTG